MLNFSYKVNKKLCRKFEEIEKICKNKSEQIVDCRPTSMFEKGCIPNAINVPAPGLFKEDGTLKPKEDIMKMFSASNVDTAKPVVFSCQTGVLASLGLAVAEHCGLKGAVSVYDGSYSEYSLRM